MRVWGKRRLLCELCSSAEDGSCRYSPYRKVMGYYQDGKDAFDMRRAMKRDVRKQHVRDKPFEVDPSAVW